MALSGYELAMVLIVMLRNAGSEITLARRASEGFVIG